MKVSQSLDIVVSCLIISLCLSVLSSAIASRNLVVLGVRLLRTSKLLEKKETDKNFDDVRWVLTRTHVAPECRDTARPTRPYRGTI
jgi:hypothetical protein